MKRVCVVGNSGSGKSTLAAALAGQLGVNYLELDSVFHQPGWQPLEREAFRERIEAFTQASTWVVDGNYRRSPGRPAPRWPGSARLGPW